MSLCATSADFHHLYQPTGFDITNRAVPPGYLPVPAGQLVESGDIFWSRKLSEWNYTAAPGLTALEGQYYRKVTTERVFHDVPHQPGRFNS